MQRGRQGPEGRRNSDGVMVLVHFQEATLIVLAWKSQESHSDPGKPCLLYREHKVLSPRGWGSVGTGPLQWGAEPGYPCLLYTSDAADDRYVV